MRKPILRTGGDRRQAVGALAPARAASRTIIPLAADAHYSARGNIERIPAMNGGSIAAPGIVPELSGTPGAVRHGAPRLGQHTDEVLAQTVLTADRIAELKAPRVVG